MNGLFTALRGVATALEAPPPGVERFEYLETGENTCLVRLALPQPALEDEPLELRLTVKTASRDVDVAPLPAADGKGLVTREIDGAWQAGFSVPLALIQDGGARYDLWVDDRPPVRLPRPTRHEPGPRIRRMDKGETAEAIAELRLQLAEEAARAEREQERRLLAEGSIAEEKHLRAEIGAALQAEHTQRVEVERHVHELSEQAEAARGEAAGLGRQLEEVSGAAEAALVEIAAAEARSREESELGAELRRQLDETQELLAVESAARVAGDGAFAGAREEIEHLTHARVEVEARVAELVESVDGERRQRADLEEVLRGERDGRVEAEQRAGGLADEREKRLTSEHEARELAEAEHAARAAAQGSEERLAQALSVLSDGGRAHS